MNILYVSQHYPPEIGAPSTRAFELSQNWVSEDTKVTVLTALPNYPLGKFYEGYENGEPLKEEIQGISVYRCKIDPLPFKNKISRLRNYVSFFISAFKEAKKIKNFNMVFATIGPIPVAMIAYIIAKRNKVPFILEFRDITSQQIQATKYAGILVCALVEKYELFFARRSDLLVTVSDGYKQFFVNKGINGNKIRIVKNGFDFSKNAPEGCSKKNKDIIQLLKEKKKEYKVICGYFGTLGISQNILSLVKEMSLFPEILLVLIGQGAQYDELRNFLNSNKIDNAVLFSSIPEKDISTLYGYIDYSLSVLRRSDHFLPTIPSKIFRSMGYRTIPLFMGPDGEAAAIVKEINENLYLKSTTDFKQIIDLEKQQLKEKAYELCKSKYNRASQAQELLTQLKITLKDRTCKKMPIKNIFSLVPIVTSKVLDRFLKQTGLYGLSFRSIINTGRSKNFEDLPVFPVAVEDKYLQALKNDLYSVFINEVRLEQLEINSQSDKPFWRVSWKGFDPKDYWEIARGWQWLPAYLGTETNQDKELIIEKILIWLEANTYPNGLAWVVNLDVAVRSINLLLINQLCHDERFNASLWQHYQYIKKRIWLSRMSMQNNHYLGELTALAILAKLFDQKEQQEYRQELEKEFKKQFYNDGVNVEQSMRYHAFSVQFALIAKFFLDLDLPFLEKALDFVLMMQKPDGEWPSFGDDDMGCVFRLNSKPMTEDYNALLGFLGLLYSDSRTRYVLEGQPTEPHLFIKNAQSKWNKLERKEPKFTKVFPDGGFWVTRTGWDKKANWMMVKFGPHKWHAHADLFHIELSIGGRPILIDSGTYRYNNVPEERKYFRSTASHNCFEFDGTDQSRQLTTFRWVKMAKVTDWDITEKENGFTFFGSHDGYSPKGLIHHREIEGQKNLKEVIIRDTLEGKTEGEANAYWHFHSEIELLETDQGYQIISGLQKIGLFKYDSNDSAKAEVFETPYSEHYGNLSKKKTLVIRAYKKALQPLIVKSHFIFNCNEENL